MRTTIAWLVPVVACLPIAACHLVSGVTDLEFVDGPPGAGGTGATTTTTSLFGGGGTTTTTTTTTTTSNSGGGGAGGDGGGGSAGCLIGIEDDFDGASLDGMWASDAQGGATVSVANGRLVLAPATDTVGTWASVLSNGTFDLTECAVMVEVAQTLNVSGDAVTTFTVNAGDYSNSFGFSIRDGNIVCRVNLYDTLTELSTTPHSPSEHRWLRLRESGGELYCETSGSGSTGTWTEHARTTSPWFASDLHVSLGAGAWTTGAPNPGEARFDNLNLPP